ncbi:MAG: enoyl-CoA hydratase/isomerase family protein [Candidatus Obscuribacterales bacterium]|nr:enoyl-CoA hydratase/isomerase family protein [Candidatus Obscuribacterales bacterium]
MQVTPITVGKSVSLGVIAERQIAVITFDQVDSKVNLLSSAVMAELAAIVDRLEKASSNYRGLIIISGKANVFIAGADIKEIQSARTVDQKIVFEACENGKKLLDRIKALPYRKVAAVNGRCLGGGLEVALHCNHIVATGNESTVFGLPEVGLGVLPGWGGSILAPRKVGFVAALPLILQPLKPWSARRAWQEGLVSEVVAEENLMKRAVEIALGARIKRYEAPTYVKVARALGNTFLARFVVSKITEIGIKKAPKDNRLAARSALKVMNAAFSKSTFAGYKLESETFARLSHTEQCGNCVQKFLDYQASKKKG